MSCPLEKLLRNPLENFSETKKKFGKKQHNPGQALSQNISRAHKMRGERSIRLLKIKPWFFVRGKDKKREEIDKKGRLSKMQIQKHTNPSENSKRRHRKHSADAVGVHAQCILHPNSTKSGIHHGAPYGLSWRWGLCLRLRNQRVCPRLLGGNKCGGENPTCFPQEGLYFPSVNTKKNLG